MEVRFYATLRDVVGERTAIVDLEESATVSDMLESLFARHPDLRPKILDEAGELRHAVNIFVNGRSIRFLEGFDTELPQHTEVSIFPPVAGG